MDKDLQDIAISSMLIAIRKMQKINSIVSIDRQDDKLVFKNKAGLLSEVQLPTVKDGKDGLPGKPGLSIKGDKGDPGLSIKGDKGERGLEGKQGKSIKGDRGLRGLQGLQGKKGDKGDKGDDADIKLLADNIEFAIDKFGHLIVTIFGKKTDLGRIKTKAIGGGGGVVEAKFTESTPMTYSVGGYEEGSTFSNVNHNEMWRGLLYGSQRPAFTTFNINIDGVYEVGDRIYADEYQASWIINNEQYLEPNSIRIDYINDSTVLNLANNLPNISPTRINIPEIKIDVPKSISFKITGLSISQGEFSRSLIVSFYNKIYVGENSSPILNADQIRSLRINRLASNIDGDYQLEALGYKYFCYPVSMGPRFNFIDDATELEVAMDDPKKIMITNDFGVTVEYYVYRSYYKLNSALQIKVY